MPRPCKKKYVSSLPAYGCFIHSDQPVSNNYINMSVEEYETIRLIDYLQYTQEDCANHMQTSRGTVQMLYDDARRKVSRFLVEGSSLVIDGGNYELQQAQRTIGDDNMKIAVTYNNGQVFQHFGHTQTFKIYEVHERQIVSTQVVDTGGSGHGALVGLLKQHGVEILICGGIGGGAKHALQEVGIQLYGGACGDADTQVISFLHGKLQYNPSIQCSHHEENHTCGSHEHSCTNHQ